MDQWRELLQRIVERDFGRDFVADIPDPSSLFAANQAHPVAPSPSVKTPFQLKIELSKTELRFGTLMLRAKNGRFDYTTLRAALKKATGEHRDTELIIAAHKDRVYEQLIALMDAVRDITPVILLEPGAE